MKFAKLVLVMAMVAIVALCEQGAIAEPPAGTQQDRFVQTVEQLIEYDIIPGGVQNPRVIDAIRSTPRHEFVPLRWRPWSYVDMALPIGDQQTISSPFVVAYMTECLDPQPTDKVLEIGTGSGYQAAVLSPLVAEVYTIEIVPSLTTTARQRLNRLGYRNVHVQRGDGFLGWPEHAPFDKIIVTCSPEEVPQPLVEQLRDNGRMVIPVGERYQQTLYLMTKVDGQLKTEALRPTLFVPMTGRAESQRDVQPDPANPRLENGSFEQPADSPDVLPGWYYERQVRRIQSPDAPDGEYVARFRNQVPGQASRLLQGLGVDGRQVQRVELSAWYRLEDVQKGPLPESQANVALTFYDHQRREVGTEWLGPWQGTTADWQYTRRSIRVPPTAREAIVRVGLFGATGTMELDLIRVQAIKE